MTKSKCQKYRITGTLSSNICFYSRMAKIHKPFWHLGFVIWIFLVIWIPGLTIGGIRQKAGRERGIDLIFPPSPV